MVQSFSIFQIKTGLPSGYFKSVKVNSSANGGVCVHVSACESHWSSRKLLNYAYINFVLFHS